jgi:putative transposase
MELSRDSLPVTQHFFTAALAGQSVSALTEHVDTLLLAFRACRDRYPFTMTAGVILPDHLHCIFALPAEDAARSARWRLIQGLFERVIGGGRGQWRSFEEQEIVDDSDLQRRIDYIHSDPVRHGMVRTPRKWPYSSLHAYISHGLRPLYWTGDVVGSYAARFAA